MIYNSQKKEQLNTVLFLLFLISGIILNLTFHFNSKIEFVWLAFLLFSGIIYGFVSKNSIKSFFVGSLPFPIAVVVATLLDNSSSESLESLLPFIGGILIYLALGGLAGSFMAQENEDHEKKKRQYIALSAFIISSVFLYFALASGLWMGLIITFSGLSGYFMAWRIENKIIRLVYIGLSVLFLVAIALTFIAGIN